MSDLRALLQGEVPLQFELFETSDEGLLFVCELFISTSKAIYWWNLFAIMESPLNDLILCPWTHSSHLVYLAWAVKDVVHQVETTKSQPNNSSILFKGHLPSHYDDWVRRLTSIFLFGIYFHLKIPSQNTPTSPR